MKRFVCIVLSIVTMSFFEGYGMLEEDTNNAHSTFALSSVRREAFVSNSSKFRMALDILQSDEGNKREGAEAMVNEALNGNMFAIDFLYNSFGISDLESEISRNGRPFVIEEIAFSF